MSMHIFATIVTSTAVAANNRGEGDGSTLSTLQKITRGNDQYTTVSAEAIRWGLREYLQNLDPSKVNRTFDPDKDQYNFKKDGQFNATEFADDDLFGFMDAKKDSSNKDATTKRRGALEVSRAMSLDPFWGDVAFGAKGGTKGKTSLHGSEMHCTSYQYTVALTPESLKSIDRATMMLDAICALRHVGGNHARFLYDFRPESIIIRVTADPSPWIMDSFKRMGEGIGCPRLVRLIEVGDVAASELIIGGEIVDTLYDEKITYSEKLNGLGVTVHRGVKEALSTAKAQLSRIEAKA
jgi:CRISPR-associated protein Cst2